MERAKTQRLAKAHLYPALYMIVFVEVTPSEDCYKLSFIAMGKTWPKRAMFGRGYVLTRGVLHFPTSLGRQAVALPRGFTVAIF